jgi:uncharacterized protein (TIGR02996 family)
MTPDDAFLADIIGHPDDDGLRLIYADYLDERGDPRGEFIRVQVELVSLPRDDPRRPALKVKERQLQQEHERKWAGPLASLVQDWWFQRGFIEVVAMHARAFLGYAQLVFRLAPVCEVRLSNASGKMARLADCPQLERLVTLDLSNNPIRDDGLQELLGSPYLGRLQTVYLGYTGLGAAGGQALAASSGLGTLAELWLEENHLGDAGVRALAASPHLGRLRTLALQDNGIGDDGARALLGSSSLASLEAVDLRRNPISEPVKQALEGRFGTTACTRRW